MKQLNTLQGWFLLTFVMAGFFGTNMLHACESDEQSRHFAFIENNGQWQDNIQYQAELNVARLFLEQDKLTYLLIDPADVDAVHASHHDPSIGVEEIPIDLHAFYVHFDGANPDASLSETCMVPTYRNYFLGNDQSKWASNVRLYEQVEYLDMYNDIDMRIYSQEGHIKYDFIVGAGANVEDIALTYEGLDDLYIEAEALYMVTSVNTVIEQAPLAYQYVDGQYNEVACNFVLTGNTLRFEFPDGYDTSEELIIDPVLIFGSYTGSTTDNWGFTATFDDNGNLYAGGASFGFGYPTTPGAYQTVWNGGDGTLPTDVGISKFSADGTNLIYSTYLGGTVGNEIPHSMIVSPEGELIVYGTTGSSDYPTTAGAWDAGFNGGTNTNINNIGFTNGSDIYVALFSEDGATLEASTFVGGLLNDGLNLSTTLRFNYGDGARGEVGLDADNNIIIATCSQSPDFPTTPDSPYPFFIGGTQDGVLFKMSADLSNLLFGTYIGGLGDDAAYSVKSDADGFLYLAGGTTSADFPTTPGALLETYQGGIADGFMAKFHPDGTTLDNATYIGTNGYDQAFFVDLDDNGAAYTVGQTDGLYPVVGSVYNNPNSGQFLHKLTDDLGTTEWSTVFGNGDGNPDIVFSAFLVDKCGQIFVSGWGGNVNGAVFGSTTTGLPITPADAWQSTTDGSDFYFLVLEKDAADIEYGTFYGSPSGTGEHVDGGTSRFSKDGIAYQAVCAGCGGSSLFPTTPDAWSTTNNAANCNLGVIKFDFELASTIAAFVSTPPTGCAPYSIDFENQSTNADTYFWDFGDGVGTSTEVNPSYVYTEAGDFTITLVAIQEGSCNVSDTTSVSFTVIEPDASFSGLDESYCGLLDLAVELVPVTPGGTFSGIGVDGNLFVPGNVPVAMSGMPIEITYFLDIEDCIDEQSQIVTVIFPDDPTFTPQDFCANDAATAFATVSSGGTWSGDIGSDGIFDPFMGAGTYSVTYTTGEAGCTDASTQEITVFALPEITIVDGPYCLNDGTDNFEMIVSVTGDGGSYTLGGDFSGTVDDGAEITLTQVGNASIYTLTATDDEFSCAASIEIEAPSCPDCFPDAGEMPTDLQLVCADGTVSAQTTGEIVEAGMVLVYALHTSPTNVLSGGLAWNQTGIFSFADLMGGQYNTEYYISAVVGFPDGDGFPMADDPCTVVAEGTPVVFLEPLGLEVDEFCDYGIGEYTVTFMPTGGYPSYNPSDPLAVYTLVGDFLGDLMPGVSGTILFQEEGFHSYQLSILDDGFGCGIFEVISEEFECTKTAIELLRFTGENTASGNLLNWTTATEENNDYFTLEYSTNGNQFTTLATLEGAGTTTVATNYQYVHKDPACGTAYYRLHWTDFNGVTETSQTIAVQADSESVGTIDIAPVPTQDRVNLSFATQANVGATLQVFDVTGRLMRSEQVGTTDECKVNYQLNMATFTTGMYFIQIVNGEQMLTGKIVKE